MADGAKSTKSKVSAIQIIDEEDARQFSRAADSFDAANTSPQAARNKLIELGAIDTSGQPMKRYR